MSDDPARRTDGPHRPLPEAVYERALEVGRTAAGRSGPNPPVGCVIVRDGRIVGEGATSPVGGPHAEVIALEAAGPAARGAVAVVTLEPCAHHGRTPPCTDALVSAGVAEVHVLQRDPDPTARGGAGHLRAAGIGVLDVADVMPALADRAAHDLRGFLARVAHGRPHVHLKLAQDARGRTTAADGRYLTGEAARRRVHALRAEVDAVLVGGATLRQDDPGLDVRHVPTRAQPRPVVLSTSADLPDGSRALRPGAIVVTGPTAAAGRVERLRARGVDVAVVPSADDGGLDLAAALATLLERRVLTVLAEPGPRLVRALVGQGLVDVVELHVAGAAASPGGRILPAVPEVEGLLADAAGVSHVVTTDGDLILVDRAPEPARVPERVR